MSDRLGQLERQLTAQNKRIVELEGKYLALLEDIKKLRAHAEVPRGTIPPENQIPIYQPAFDRWPGAAR